jgi:hypothetical protein
MFRPALALSLALILPLAAAAAAGTLASVEEFAHAIGMKPGGWRTNVKVTAAEIRPSPAADPAIIAETQARIEAQLGVANERNECLEPAGKGELRLPGIIIDPVCTFSGMQAADGRWALTSSCRLPESDQSGTLTAQGTYSRKAVTGRHEGDISYKGVVVHLTAQTESRWVGKCRTLKSLHVTADGD